METEIRPSDFITVRIQASGFVASDEVRPSLVLKQAVVEWEGEYDGEVMSLPNDSQAPPFFPVVQMFSRDQSQLLQASRNRVDAIWSRQGVDGEYEVGIASVLESFAVRLAAIAANQRLAFGRLGAIVTRSARVTAPGKRLAEHFCRDRWLSGPLNRPEGFELHAHKTFLLLPEISVNSWMRIKTSKGQSQLYEQVLIEQDINTLAEELAKRQFSAQEMLRWFGASADEADKVLALYFPDRQYARGGLEDGSSRPAD